MTQQNLTTGDLEVVAVVTPSTAELLELLAALRDLARGATTQEELDLLTRVDALLERDAEVQS